MSQARLQLPPVAPGSTVAVVSPASTPQAARVEAGIAALTQLGYHPRAGAAVLARGPLYFAGAPEMRLNDLHEAFAHPEVRAIFCTRGGYGSNYLLEDLDAALISVHPKPLIGYSDLTAPLLYLLDEIGLPAFHGPMLSADFAREDGVHSASLLAALAGTPYDLGAAEGLRTLKPGQTSGTLYGGCLSIIAALLGTPWEPQTEGKLLFLEDVNAKPYQIDRMLWQLRQAGKFDGVRGIIFGEMLDCQQPGAPATLLEEVLQHALEDFDGPVAIGLRSGHVSRSNVTLTFGADATFQATADACHLHIAAR